MSINCLTTDDAIEDKKMSYLNKMNNRNGRKKINKSIDKIIFHDIDVAIKLYKNVFNFDFPEDLEWWEKAVNYRHDCAHRAGLNKKGKPVSGLNFKYNKELIEDAIDLAENIDEWMI